MPTRSHSITSSARASNLAGNSVPSALATFKLTTNFNLVGRCTGSSAGGCSFQNLADVNADLTKRIGNTRSVIHEATGRRKFRHG